MSLLLEYGASNVERPGRSGLLQRELVELYLKHGSIERVLFNSPELEYSPVTYGKLLKKWGIVVGSSSNPIPISQSEEAFREVIETGQSLNMIVKNSRWKRRGSETTFARRLTAIQNHTTYFDAICLLLYKKKNPDFLLFGQDTSTSNTESGFQDAPYVPPVSYMVNPKNTRISAISLYQQEVLTEMALLGELAPNSKMAATLIPERMCEFVTYTIFDTRVHVYCLPFPDDLCSELSSYRLQKLDFRSALDVGKCDLLDSRYRLGVVELINLRNNYPDASGLIYESEVNKMIREAY